MVVGAVLALGIALAIKYLENKNSQEDKNEIIEEGKKNTEEIKNLLRGQEGFVRNSLLEEFNLEEEYGVTKEQLVIFASNIEEFSNNKIDVGHSFFILDKYKEAKNEYDQAIILNDKNADAYFFRGLTQSFIILSQTSEDILNINSTIYANNFVPYNLVDEYKKIIQDYETSIEIKKSFSAYYNKGLLHFELGELEDAELAFTNSIKTNPGKYFLSYAHSSRGSVLIEIGKSKKNQGDKGWKEDVEGAEDDFFESVELNPSSPIILCNRGRFYYEIEMKDEAIADLEKAANLNDDYAVPHLYLGKIREILEKDYPKAIEHYKDGLDRDAFNKALNFAYGVVLAERLEDYPNSIIYLNKAIEIDANFWGAYWYRGYSYLNSQNYPNAIDDFTTYLDVDRTQIHNLYNKQEERTAILNAHRYRGIARFYRRDGQYKEVIDDFTPYLKENPKDWEVLYYRSFCYMRLGEMQLAHADLKISNEENPKLEEWIQKKFNGF